MNIYLLKKYILDNWSELFQDLKQPGDIRFLVSYSPYGRHCKAEILIFPDSSPKPIARCKFPILDSDRYIDSEFKTITELGNYPILTGSIPHIIAIPYIEEKKVWIESIQEGIPLKKYFQVNQNQSIPEITNWLVDLHMQNHQLVTINQNWLDVNILQPLNEIRNMPGNSDSILEESIDYIRNIIKPYSDKSIPLCRVHNDFRINKITLLKRDKFYIIDWELSEQGGYPLVDLLIFIIDVISVQNNVSFNKAVEYIMTGKVSSDYKNVLQHYLIKIDLDINMWPLLILLFGVNRVQLAREIIFPLQSYDGIEWAKNSFSILNNIVSLLKSNQCKFPKVN